jgi:hypothetical protein
MTGRSILQLVLFLAWISTGLSSSLVVYQMVEDVNRKLPPDRQIEYAYWYFGKLAKLKKQYRSFCPDGRLIIRFNLLITVSSLLGLAFAWQFGFFR